MAQEVAIERLEKPEPVSFLRDQAKAAGISIDFDPDELVEKYRIEREKRQTALGLSQYRLTQELSLSKYLRDPYADHSFKREPISADYDVVVIGGGFSGLQAAARLLEKGITKLAVIEKGDDYGGTWYLTVDRHWNRYPGAQCDIESYIYMPMLEELKYVPTEKYARGPELRKHAKAIADLYSIPQKTLFQTQAERMTWDEAAGLWKIETNWTDKITARWVVPAPGPLSTPKFPGVNVEAFKGVSFHSCRWDYTYTGGSPEKPDLIGLNNKRVAIIGTGATAVQIVPRVGEWAKELFVVQRTPSSVDVRNNRNTDANWARNLPAGWQRARMENFTAIISGEPVKDDLVADGWTNILRSLPGFFGTGDGQGADPHAIAARMQLTDFKKMESIRRRVDSIVKDPKTANSLKPWYNQFCKRPCFHDEYLQTFNRPSVTLIDTNGKGIETLTEKGFIVDGKEYEIDCLIYATGFEWNSDFSKRNGCDIIGRGGVSLSEAWKDGPVTLHGWAVPQFPNMMLLTPVQSGANPNFTHNSAEMTRHLAYMIKEAESRGIKSLDPKQEAADAWVDETVQTGAGRGEFLKQCTPGYYNDEGRLDDITFKTQPYGGGGPKFNKIIGKWRTDNKFEGMSITYFEQQNGAAKGATNGTS
ncbi:FAD/NAD(P)-binding domain-containing protein [Pyrenochaeta sp. DS3sAY3a]|nr:FAD/NAD(P)-binding domain-containing protein [Pyrenochaeta sp. DS3sAY3a]